VALIDLSRDGKPEMLVLDETQVTVFTRETLAWEKAGTLILSDMQAADFKAGKLATQQPEFDDLKIGDARAERMFDMKSAN
jgi:hypothetical protein